MTATITHDITPVSAGWTYLGVQIVRLPAGEQLTTRFDDQESAIVVVQGSVTTEGDAGERTIGRPSPFTARSDLLYQPPGYARTLRAATDTELAIGMAPADGRYPPRIISPGEMTSELRGGGPAYRQIITPLASPLPAERLICYEAYLPRGAWSGWPPHRHDGEDGSPYLEETYYFRFDRPSGFGVHRNYTGDGRLDEHIPIRDQSMVTVPRGYHLCAASPAANVWILNFLAGSPEDRPRPPVFDQAETWITSDWSRGLMTLPVVLARHHATDPASAPGRVRSRRNLARCELR